MTTRAPVVALAFLCAVSIAFWWRSLIETFGLALASDAYTHIILIIPLSATLIYLNSKVVNRNPQPSLGVGGALLVLVLGMGCYVRWGIPAAPDDVRLSLSMFALVCWWIASVLLCFGKRTLQTLLFPLCFLFWIVPLPTVVLDEVVYFLQYHSAIMARIMFMAVGVPVTQDGVMLSLPSVDIEVARECSSIRSSMLLVVITMILAHLFLRSWWRKVLLIGAAIPLAAFKNGFRIFTITELATRVDPGYFDGNLHHRGGIVFLAIALAITCVLLWGLRRTEAVKIAPAKGLEP